MDRWHRLSHSRSDEIDDNPPLILFQISDAQCVYQRNVHNPAGTFQMGSATGYVIEKPVHSVTLSSFRMGATPVTVATWKEYCAATTTALPTAPEWGFLDDHPVVNVS